MFEKPHVGKTEEQIKEAEKILNEKASELELEHPLESEGNRGQFYGEAARAGGKSIDNVCAPTEEQLKKADEILEDSNLKDAHIE